VQIVQHVKTAKGNILDNRRKAEILASAQQADAPAVPKEYVGRAAAAGHKIAEEKQEEGGEED
jgi:predicted lactoylglutathione lyase